MRGRGRAWGEQGVSRGAWGKRGEGGESEWGAWREGGSRSGLLLSRSAIPGLVEDESLLAGRAALFSNSVVTAGILLIENEFTEIRE